MMMGNASGSTKIFAIVMALMAIGVIVTSWSSLQTLGDATQTQRVHNCRNKP